MKTWTDAYAEVRAKTEEQMGPTGVVLELSHEDWEKMQRGAALDELKSLKKEDADQDMKDAKEKKKREDDRKWEAERGQSAADASQPTSAGGRFKGSNTYKQR